MEKSASQIFGKNNKQRMQWSKSIRIMTKLFLSSSMIESICNQNSQTLQVLNLETCGGTHDESLSEVFNQIQNIAPLKSQWLYGKETKKGTHWHYNHQSFISDVICKINTACGPCLEMEMSADPTDLYFLSPTPAPMLTWLRECERPPPVLWREREVSALLISQSTLYSRRITSLARSDLKDI